MTHKGRAIHVLSQNLRSELVQASNLPLAGVVQLIASDRYWGDIWGPFRGVAGGEDMPQGRVPRLGYGRVFGEEHYSVSCMPLHSRPCTLSSCLRT